MKPTVEVAELLARNPDADIDQIRRLCESYRLGGFDKILEEMSGWVFESSLAQVFPGGMLEKMADCAPDPFLPFLSLFVTCLSEACRRLHS